VQVPSTTARGTARGTLVTACVLLAWCIGVAATTAVLGIVVLVVASLFV
jgi:hypothetical protein